MFYPSTKGKLMARRINPLTTIYPVFVSAIDLWYARILGDGLGNCFYTYFHAVVMAKQFGAAVITPPWLVIRIGPLLRRERSNRMYWRMFKPFAGEIHGVHKFFALLGIARKRTIVEIGGSNQTSIVRGALNCVVCRKFTFRGLHPYRDLIRERLLGIINHPMPTNHGWGKGGFVAVHVRLGDFAQISDPRLLLSGKANLRIPISWYVNVVREIRRQNEHREIYVFSDGGEKELEPLLALGAKWYRSGSDITDLLAMSAASMLVGSSSTYSRWAAFLGDMPSIWLKKEIEDEKPTGPDTRIIYIPIDGSELGPLAELTE
jgi:hypothetical protein